MNIAFSPKSPEHPEPYREAYDLALARPECAKQIHFAAQRDLGLAESLVEFLAELPRDILLIEVLSRFPWASADNLSYCSTWELANRIARSNK